MPTGYRPYGATIADFVTSVNTISETDVFVPAGSVTLTVWNAASGGTQVTDLLAADGATAQTSLTTDANGRLLGFYAPDTVATVWIDGGAGFRSRAVPLDSDQRATWDGVTDKPSTYPPAAHNHDDRYYTETEADARYYTQTQVDDLLDDVDATVDLASLATVLTGDVSGVRVIIGVTHDGTDWPEVPSGLATSSAIQMLFMDFAGTAAVPSQGREDVDVVLRDASGD